MLTRTEKTIGREGTHRQNTALFRHFDSGADDFFFFFAQGTFVACVWIES